MRVLLYKTIKVFGRDLWNNKHRFWEETLADVVCQPHKSKVGMYGTYEWRNICGGVCYGVTPRLEIKTSGKAKLGCALLWHPVWTFEGQDSQLWASHWANQHCHLGQKYKSEILHRNGKFSLLTGRPRGPLSPFWPGSPFNPLTPFNPGSP